MNWKLNWFGLALLAWVVGNLGGEGSVAVAGERLWEVPHATTQGEGWAAGEPTDEPVGSFRLMSFNIWVGGEAGGQPLEQTAAVIKAAQADVVGIQESWSQTAPKTDNAERLAKMLGWQHVNLQGGSTSIISRFPIGEKSPGGWGATIQVSATQSIVLFNAHLAPAPYQPYQLASIKYGTGRFITTEAEAIDEARKARGAQVDALLKDVKEVLAQNRPLFLTGDLNKPSHQDWTAAAAELGHCQIKVQYPTTKAISDLGFVDAFRAFFPDESKVRGYTWTPTKPDNDPSERHDRIDYVFYRHPEIQLTGVQVVGESEERGAHIVVTPYPSDHRGVVAEFQWKNAREEPHPATAVKMP